MARTKQCARKSTGGMTPMKQSPAPSALRKHMTGQQASASVHNAGARNKKTSYLNYENILSSFGFAGNNNDVPASEGTSKGGGRATRSKKKGQQGQQSTAARTTDDFAPTFSTGVTLANWRNPGPPNGDGEGVQGGRSQWMSMAINSRFDGDGMKTAQRPALDVALAIDVSGSMNSPMSWEEGQPRVSKLKAAQQNLVAVLGRLREGDRISLVAFHHEARVLLTQRPFSAKAAKDMEREVLALHSGGGTSISTGFLAARDTLVSKKTGKAEEDARTRRIIFFTDMQTNGDEDILLQLVEDNASEGVYTTVVGVGMDFNVELVQHVSKQVGCRYSSATSAESFRALVEKGFEYDVTLIAKNIKLTLLSPGLEFEKGYGSPELHLVGMDGAQAARNTPVPYQGRSGFGWGCRPAVPPPVPKKKKKKGKQAVDWRREVVLSSEFPSEVNAAGEKMGGVLLFKLRHNEQSAPKNACRKGKGKADEAGVVRILVEFETMRGEKVAREHVVPLDGKTVGFHGPDVRKAVALVRYIDEHDTYVLDDSKQMNDAGSTCAAGHQKYMDDFTLFRKHFLEELHAVGDHTADKGGENVSFVEIMDKVIALEAEAVKQAEANLEAEKKRNSKGGLGSLSDGGVVEAIAREVECPICGEVVRDPHALPCLHSFCLACINQLGAAARNCRFKCPTCRASTTADAATRNFMLGNIADRVRDREKVQQGKRQAAVSPATTGPRKKRARTG